MVELPLCHVPLPPIWKKTLLDLRRPQMCSSDLSKPVGYGLPKPPGELCVNLVVLVAPQDLAEITSVSY